MRSHSHGSLYFAANAFCGCTAPGITGDIGDDLKEYVESRFVIGPVAEESFNESGSNSDEVNRGPCMCPTAS